MTIHPSALLRLQDVEGKRSGYASFVKDFRSIERLLDYSTDETNPDIRAANTNGHEG
jgi:hypothetical protein